MKILLSALFDRISILAVPPESLSVRIGVDRAVILFILNTILPLNVVEGVMVDMPTLVEVGPHAPLADSPVRLCPPNAISKVPAVLPVTV
jgi:hypothetical protein